MPRDDRAGDRSPVESSGAVDTESTFHLIERARGGDQEAVDRLLTRHVTPLRRWARGKLPKWARDAVDTDDLVQDTLLQTFKKLGDFDVRGPGALQAYLRQAILNRVRDELRKKGRRPQGTCLVGLEVDGGLSPLEEAIGHQAIERYEHGLAMLRPVEREAIIGRVEMGYSYEELADVLGKTSPEAARKAAKRALERLIRQMELPST
jgi:RNA polymerase sigma-70 factor (ECF subfamily)